MGRTIIAKANEKKTALDHDFLAIFNQRDTHDTLVFSVALIIPLKKKNTLRWLYHVTKRYIVTASRIWHSK